jgi:protein required for attachment to host cells
MKPDWTLIANATRARLLQQERGAPMVILESFVHPRGRGNLNASAMGHVEFARELAHLLEQEAQLDHFRSLTIFAASPFLGEIRSELGKATVRRLVSSHEQDLTGFGLSELEQRIAHELAPRGDLVH